MVSPIPCTTVVVQLSITTSDTSHLHQALISLGPPAALQSMHSSKQANRGPGDFPIKGCRHSKSRSNRGRTWPDIQELVKNCAKIFRLRLLNLPLLTQLSMTLFVVQRSAKSLCVSLLRGCALASRSFPRSWSAWATSRPHTDTTDDVFGRGQI